MTTSGRAASLAARLHRAALWIAYRMQLVAWFVLRPQRRGAFVAVWHRGRVLAIRNSYRSGLALPAGGIRRGEAPLDAALRELREEVGISLLPDALRFAGEITSRYEFKRDRCTFFEVELADLPLVRPDQREVVWADFVEAGEALRGPLVPPVRAYLEGRAKGIR